MENNKNNLTLSGVPPGVNSVTVIIGLETTKEDFFFRTAAVAEPCLDPRTLELWTEGVEILRRP